MAHSTKNAIAAASKDFFDPGKLSAEEKSYLDRLLGKIEDATKERSSQLSKANSEAMESWILAPDWARIALGYRELFSPIDKERVRNAFQPGSGHLDEKHLIYFSYQRTEDIKAALAYLSSDSAFFLDNQQERKNKKEIAALYKTTLSRFPALLNNRNDVNGAIHLGELFRERKKSLTDIWQEASVSRRLTAASSLLETAYPDDDVSHLHILETSSDAAAAAYTTAFDTILCGSLFTKEKTWGFSVFLLSHEYQHRRQHVLADQYKNDSLEKGSPEYYQGRLYNTNFSGGYVSPNPKEGAIAQAAGLIEYFDQPVERQANNIASLASTVGGTSGAAVWRLNEGLTRIFSRIAKPVDYVMHKIESINGARTPAGKPPRP